MFFINNHRKYKTEAHRATLNYHDVVSVSDEAFVWQLMTYYYPMWSQEKNEKKSANTAGNENDDELSVDDERAAAGPKKGFRDTASKTVPKYNEYCYIMGQSRAGPNAKLWGNSLKLAAKRNMKPEKKKGKGPTEDKSVVEPMMPTMDWLQFTTIDLCEMEDGKGTSSGMFAV